MIAYIKPFFNRKLRKEKTPCLCRRKMLQIRSKTAFFALF